MKYIQYSIISLFLTLSGLTSASGLPISNDPHKRNICWAKHQEAVIKYAQLRPSLVPCPPPIKDNTVAQLNAVKRTN